MANINTMFTRTLLSTIVPTVREAGKSPMKDGWVWNAGRDHWEFHGPDNFYWHGNAGDAYEARYKGWSAWLENPKGKH
jgi:hypothetical protein